jgi:hypothetical protein
MIREDMNQGIWALLRNTSRAPSNASRIMRHASRVTHTV